MKHSCNFKSKGNVFLVRCEGCDKENYALAVASGKCAWCGYDANEEKKLKN